MLIAVKLPGGNVNPLSVTASCGVGDSEDREAKDSRQEKNEELPAVGKE